jgi:hypothetical protein
MEGMNQAAEAARRRALMTQAYGSELGNQRRMDLDTESRNKDLINRFNQMNLENRNAANMFNLRNRQGVYNQNVGLRNEAVYNNQINRNAAAQQNYANQMAKAAALNNQYMNQADFFGAQAAANARKRQALGGMIGAGMGAAFGGPAGAQMGHAAGTAWGDFF